MSRVPCIAAAMLVVGWTGTAHATKARDVVNMTADQQGHYISGAVSMAAYQFYFQDGKDMTRARCASDWYYQNNDSIPEIMDNMRQMPDQDPIAILAALIKRKCGVGKQP